MLELEEVRANLQSIKMVLDLSSMWVMKIGISLTRSDILHAIESIDQWRAEVESILVQEKTGTSLNDEMVTWVREARQLLQQEGITAWRAVYELRHITPSVNRLILDIANILAPLPEPDEETTRRAIGAELAKLPGTVRSVELRYGPDLLWRLTIDQHVIYQGESARKAIQQTMLYVIERGA